MKKIVIVFDGRHFSEGAFAFLSKLNAHQPVLATGVFLPAIDYSELLFSMGGMTGPVYFNDIESEDLGIVQKNIDHFKALCLSNGIEYRVHPDIEHHVISQVKLESRYADLLVIGSDLFYENLGEDLQDDYLENTLHKTECPVVLLPEHSNFPENVILAYDGGSSSVYAIKQFAYLFQEFTKFKTILVSAGKEPVHAQDVASIEELAACHFNNLTTLKLEIDPKRDFNTWLIDNGNPILVTGAFGRSRWSEMFKKSFISDVIDDHKVPIFVAHR